jgi:hypothetical protein
MKGFRHFPNYLYSSWHKKYYVTNFGLPSSLLVVPPQVISHTGNFTVLSVQSEIHELAMYILHIYRCIHGFKFGLVRWFYYIPLWFVQSACSLPYSRCFIFLAEVNFGFLQGLRHLRLNLQSHTSSILSLLWTIMWFSHWLAKHVLILKNNNGFGTNGQDTLHLRIVLGIFILHPPKTSVTT